jgi:hypothetical protein
MFKNSLPGSALSAVQVQYPTTKEKEQSFTMGLYGSMTGVKAKLEVLIINLLQ